MSWPIRVSECGSHVRETLRCSACQFTLQNLHFVLHSFCVCAVTTLGYSVPHFDDQKLDPFQHDHHQCQSQWQYTKQLAFWTVPSSMPAVFCRNSLWKAFSIFDDVPVRTTNFSFPSLSIFPRDVYARGVQISIKKRDMRRTLILKAEARPLKRFKHLSCVPETIYWRSFWERLFWPKDVCSKPLETEIDWSSERKIVFFLKRNTLFNFHFKAEKFILHFG